MITVECSDGILINVDKEMAFAMSGAIRKKLEDSSYTDRVPIQLENISSNILLKVLDFCSAHTSNTIPNLKSWDEKFVRLEPGELCELASAAYHLEIKPLVDLTCKAIAKLLKGKPPAEIRRTFNILYDFSPGDDVPPPTMRDKLRTKLHYTQKGTKDGSDHKSNNQDSGTDTRTVDELLSFINEGDPKPKKKKQKPKKKEKRSINSAINSQLSSPSQTERKQLNATKQPTAQLNDSQIDKSSNKEYENSQIFKEKLLHVSDDVRPLYEDDSQKLSSELSLSSSTDDGECLDETEEDIDPELKAAQDREVEEFRMRLESIHNGAPRAKLPLPFDIRVNITKA